MPRKSRKGKRKSRKAVPPEGAIILDDFGEGGELLRCEPVGALVSRTGVPLGELRDICSGETDEERNHLERFRRFLAQISPIAFDAEGRYMADLRDPMNGHIALLLHSRGRIELYTGLSDDET